MISIVFSKAEYKAQSEAVQRMQKRDKRGSGAKVSSLVYFSSFFEHTKLMFAGVVELSRAYFS